MPKFSKRSREKLGTCHVDLDRLFSTVVRFFDCTILEGHRSGERQDEMYKTGKSKVKWPNSTHNLDPSGGVDVAPYPIDWDDRERFHYFAGFVEGIAATLNIPITWGGAWKGLDKLNKDHYKKPFDDLVHWQLKQKE